MSQGSVDGCVDMDGLDRKGRQLLQVSGGSLFPAQVLVPVWTCSWLNAGISKFSSSPGENFQGFPGCSRPLASKKNVFLGTFFQILPPNFTKTEEHGFACCPTACLLRGFGNRGSWFRSWTVLVGPGAPELTHVLSSVEAANGKRSRNGGI